MSFPQKKFTKADGVVLALLILLCAVSFFVSFLPRGNADSFTVTTPDGVETYSLAEDRSFVVESNGISLEVTVYDRSVSVVSSTCPDHVCVQTGRISRSGQSIVCIPARVVIEITGGGGADESEDFIVG